MSETGKKVILLVVAVVVTLGAGEILLRAVGYGTITPEMNFGVNTQLSLDKGRFLPDEDLFWKLPVHPLDEEYHSIQPDVAVPAKGRSRRVLVMGDSCSRLSTAIPPYSVLLEDSLVGRDVEVWNAAVPGYTTWQGRAWLPKQLLAVQPDIAVIYFGWNDHWRATGITDQDYAARLKGSQPRLALLFSRMPNPPPLRVSVDQYRDNLQAMVDAFEMIGTRVVLVAAPSSLTQEARARILQTRYLVRGDDAIALHRQYQDVVRDLSERTNADLLDAAALFAASGTPRELLMRDGIHLTDKGHRLVATLLVAQLTPVLAHGADAPMPDIALLAERARDFMNQGGTHR